ncbi:putative membrane protein [Ehrlichia cf. muris str. EmCRT]|uniref:Putative membrane protein n=1 Tax=Ehrlichia cf. muris str. EmCRT TaxID=1359167 RepID=A0A0F3NBS8_9RICK|nr:putative membrane protein [Ehrlichia cf. muris str. EmCRT]
MESITPGVQVIASLRSLIGFLLWLVCIIYNYIVIRII